MLYSTVFTNTIFYCNTSFIVNWFYFNHFKTSISDIVIVVIAIITNINFSIAFPIITRLTGNPFQHSDMLVPNPENGVRKMSIESAS